MPFLSAHPDNPNVSGCTPDPAANLAQSTHTHPRHYSVWAQGPEGRTASISSHGICIESEGNTPRSSHVCHRSSDYIISPDDDIICPLWGTTKTYSHIEANPTPLVPSRLAPNLPTVQLDPSEVPKSKSKSKSLSFHHLHLATLLLHLPIPRSLQRPLCRYPRVSICASPSPLVPSVASGRPVVRPLTPRSNGEKIGEKTLPGPPPPSCDDFTSTRPRGLAAARGLLVAVPAA